MNLRKLCEIAEDRDTWHAIIHGVAGWLNSNRPAFHSPYATFWQIWKSIFSFILVSFANNLVKNINLVRTLTLSTVTNAEIQHFLSHHIIKLHYSQRQESLKVCHTVSRVYNRAWHRILNVWWMNAYYSLPQIIPATI